MASEALFGFVGVVLGSLTTAVVTIYSERVAGKRELALRTEQHERERQTARDTFQRESVLALQTAVSDMIKACYDELDRVLAVMADTGTWPAREWATPTAVGWSDSVLRLESSLGRVFDEELRTLAARLRDAAGQSVWARTLDEAKSAGAQIEPMQVEFNRAVTRVLTTLY
ncbi:hypothetical protein AB0M28_20645 [Streptomyces sp. NPDC051940]|uniref:hypothetical protein n=1 Tax=Streptomyces sp. NPDC051940 TaxID=3155675 RepID=UPI00342B5A8F